MANELILIIEDNEKNRRLCRDVLQVKGYKTIESETAEEGLKLALEQAPALILMDIQLPGMDGITAMKQLKADPNTQSIPIIAITASAMTNNRTTMLAEGFDGYQTKPISLKDFLGGSAACRSMHEEGLYEKTELRDASCSSWLRRLFNHEGREVTKEDRVARE